VDFLGGPIAANRFSASHKPPASPSTAPVADSKAMVSSSSSSRDVLRSSSKSMLNSSRSLTNSRSTRSFGSGGIDGINYIGGGAQDIHSRSRQSLEEEEEQEAEVGCIYYIILLCISMRLCLGLLSKTTKTDFCSGWQMDRYPYSENRADNKQPLTLDRCHQMDIMNHTAGAVPVCFVPAQQRREAVPALYQKGFRPGVDDQRSHPFR